jgi:hypothetical protein
MRHKTNDSGVWVVAIKDRTPEGLLAFDLSDILECLAPRIESCEWIAFDVDFVGESFVAEGELLTTRTLLDRSRSIEQTIDGKFLAYHERPVVAKARQDYSHFPESKAVLAVVALDSSYFEVCTKDSENIRLLKSRFSEVADEDPNRYFQ